MSFSRSWSGVLRQVAHWPPWRALALDRNGVVITAHEPSQPAEDFQPCPACVATVGENYLDACEHAASNTEAEHARAVGALRVILGGDPHPFHFEYARTRGGEEQWHEVDILPLRGMACCLVLHTDITSCKREERAHFEAENRYRILVQSTPVAYVLIDRAIRVVDYNDRFLNLAGVPPPASVRGEMAVDCIRPRDHIRFSYMVQQVFSTGEPRYFETEMEPTRGERRKIAINISRVLVDDQAHAALFCLDLSAQEFAIETLRECEARYRAVVETQTELVCRFLPDTTLTFANEAYCRFFGKTREELVNRPFLDLVPPDAQGAVRDMIARLNADNTPRTYEHATRAKDGQVRWLQWVNVQIQRGDGRVEIQGVARDVTDRRIAEESLQRTRREVSDLAARLIRVHEEECRRIAREMHDGISQQLAAHAIGIAVLAREFGSLDSELRQRLERLEVDASVIAEEVRTFSHEMHPSVVDRLGLAPALHRLARQAGIRAGIPFEADIQEPLPPLPHEMAYSVYRMTQEILGNIARHARATRFKIHLSVAQKQVRLEIDDDGVGFDPSHLEGSAALGLLNIEERVRYLHGNLAIESAPGRGTRVKIALPLSATDAA